MVWREVRYSEVKKVEMKTGAKREVKQGRTALNYNPEFRYSATQSSSRYYLRIQSVPHRKHGTSLSKDQFVDGV
jgi:hypothetical protein